MKQRTTFKLSNSVYTKLVQISNRSAFVENLTLRYMNSLITDLTEQTKEKKMVSVTLSDNVLAHLKKQTNMGQYVETLYNLYEAK